MGNRVGRNPIPMICIGCPHHIFAINFSQDAQFGTQQGNFSRN
jgi:hypothetical protein